MTYLKSPEMLTPMWDDGSHHDCQSLEEPGSDSMWKIKYNLFKKIQIMMQLMFFHFFTFITVLPSNDCFVHRYAALQ